MKNFTIDAYIKQQLIFAETMPTDAELFEHNAFGAIEWDAYVNGGKKKDIKELLK